MDYSHSNQGSKRPSLKEYSCVEGGGGGKKKTMLFENIPFKQEYSCVEGGALWEYSLLMNQGDMASYENIP
jgi:hypothetical protein